MSDEEIKLPSREELAQLPLRAIVIYAARNARRVMPLYRLPDKVPREERVRHSRAVQSAVNLAERYGCGAADAFADAAADAFAAARATDRAADAYAAAAARAADRAAYAAGVVESVYRVASAAIVRDATAAIARDIARDAAAAAVQAVGHDSALFAAANADFKALLSFESEQVEKGIDSSGAGPLGPLWPGGPPDWYLHALREFEALVSDEPTQEQNAPSDSDPEVTEPVFIVVWDPALVSAEEYADLVGSLGDLVRAHGGLGVRRLQEDTYGVVGAGVPV